MRQQKHKEMDRCQLYLGCFLLPLSPLSTRHIFNWLQPPQIHAQQSLNTQSPPPPPPPLAWGHPTHSCASVNSRDYIWPHIHTTTSDENPCWTQDHALYALSNNPELPSWGRHHTTDPWAVHRGAHPHCRYLIQLASLSLLLLRCTFDPLTLVTCSKVYVCVCVCMGFQGCITNSTDWAA